MKTLLFPSGTLYNVILIENISLWSLEKSICKWNYIFQYDKNKADTVETKNQKKIKHRRIKWKAQSCNKNANFFFFRWTKEVSLHNVDDYSGYNAKGKKEKNNILKGAEHIKEK